VALLVTVGAGLGLFNSANNAGIMESVPAEQSGLASGLLNMSRGLGTALGLATATAVFVGVGGDGHDPAQVAHAFSVTCGVLAAAAVVAALVAGLGDSSESASSPRRSLAEQTTI
jgi:MFS family permease